MECVILNFLLTISDSLYFLPWLWAWVTTSVTPFLWYSFIPTHLPCPAVSKYVTFLYVKIQIIQFFTYCFMQLFSKLVTIWKGENYAIIPSFIITSTGLFVSSCGFEPLSGVTCSQLEELPRTPWNLILPATSSLTCVYLGASPLHLHFAWRKILDWQLLLSARFMGHPTASGLRCFCSSAINLTGASLCVMSLFPCCFQEFSLLWLSAF